MSFRLKIGFAVYLAALMNFTSWASHFDLDWEDNGEIFDQLISEKIQTAANLQGTQFKKLTMDGEQRIFALTDKGVAKLFGSTEVSFPGNASGNKLALDQSFRPLAKRIPTDIEVQNGQLFYLYDEELLSNGFAGRFLAGLPAQLKALFAINTNLSFLRGHGQKLVLFDRAAKEVAAFNLPSPITKLYAQGGSFYALAGKTFNRIRGTNLASLTFDHDLTCFERDGNKIYLGTTEGFYELPLGFNKEGALFHKKLPHTEITAFAAGPEGLWVGTTRGLFLWNPHGPSRYFASKRWLHDDHVVDLILAFGGDPLVLTKTGLTRIRHVPMSLATKAMHYQKKIRERHIRFGFCSELYLKTPGDPSSAEMIDTDNDGTWSNYYMASMAFRYAATLNPEARSHAWETFEALERLEEINPLEGFPSRTFERRGFKNSDPDRWHPTEDGKWDWKAHTSSDEIIAHVFGTTAMYQLVAQSLEEKERLTKFLKKIADHIIRNNWYLVDMDKQPTLWARWNPEYVNWFPESIVDRKLNSAEIIGLLQAVYQMTGDEHYKTKAYELIDQHGYLKNILIPMSKIALTKGFIHKGNDMGDSWNHSDDLLSFVSYWVLYHTAFNEDLKKQYAAVIKDHWEIERHEQNPVWSAVYGSTFPEGFAYTEALSTLKRFPIDMVAWDVQNSHRKDITKLGPSFRGEQMKEFLPPDERQITRWNTQSFILDGGTGGHIEFGGDEFLLPYWMIRYNTPLMEAKKQQDKRAKEAKP